MKKIKYLLLVTILFSIPMILKSQTLLNRFSVEMTSDVGGIIFSDLDMDLMDIRSYKVGGLVNYKLLSDANLYIGVGFQNEYYIVNFMDAEYFDTSTNSIQKADMKFSSISNIYSIQVSQQFKFLYAETELLFKQFKRSKEFRDGEQISNKKFENSEWQNILRIGGGYLMKREKYDIKIGGSITYNMSYHINRVWYSFDAGIIKYLNFKK